MSNDRPRRPGLAYYQGASLALLLVMTGFSLLGLWGVFVIAAPSITITSFEWRSLHARSSYFKTNYVRRNGLYYALAGSDTAGITVDDATERWRDARSEALALERRDGVQKFFLWIVALVVCLPLYRFHQRVVGRAMRSSEDDGA